MVCWEYVKMTKYRIIGNMTGNSMDAVDLVLTEFEGEKIKDICSFSRPYTQEMQQKIADLRQKVYDKTKDEILKISDFKMIHDAYVQSVAQAVNDMCVRFSIDRKSIDAIGFHGKTLDHNPPSKACKDGSMPYTLQIGSGQMLADLTGIQVVYDFRSAPLMAGFDGAPLVAPHNAHIAQIEGDGIYYNGGNTSNFALISQKKAILSADAGPFNEYIDSYVRRNTDQSCDMNATFGLQGKLNVQILQQLYDIGKDYYERKLPKSGDPQFYNSKAVFEVVQKLDFCDAVCTLEYFAAYIAFQALTLIDERFDFVPRFVLFGGGWKNPLVRKSFENLIMGKGVVLKTHEEQFEDFLKRFKQKPQIIYSRFGEMMEARLFADLARYRLENKAWEIPEIKEKGQAVVCGRIALPQSYQTKKLYDDMINLAAKGWKKLS